MKWNFRGSGVALVTPFDSSGSIDYKRLAQLIDWHVEEQTDALIIAGTTGEAATLSTAEQLELIQSSVKLANNRIPVIAGTGSNNTQHAIEMSKAAEAAGVDGLLVVSPYYNRSNTVGMIRHFEAVADAVTCPVLLYNVPARTGMNMPLESIVALSKHERIVGIKEASGDLSYASEIARLCGDDFVMLSGNDDIVVPMLSIGAIGVISVVANILPKMTHRLVQTYLGGDVKESRKLQLEYNGFINCLGLETNPIPIKMAMELAGLMSGRLRLPLYELSAPPREQLTKEMQKIGLV